MTLIKVQHDKNNPYITVNKSIANDNRISYKAMGIWLYAFSRKEDWEFYQGDLVNRHTDGLDSVKSGLKELEEAGYLYRYQKQNEKGQFKGWDWIFFETSKTDDEIKEMFPKRGFSPSRLNPNSAKPPSILSNESVANKENNNNKEDVVVSSCLDELKLEEVHKKRLLSENDQETLRIAVSRVIAWEGRASDSAAIETVLKRKETWVDKPDSSIAMEKNDSFLSSLREYDGINVNGVQIIIGSDYIEFSGGTRCDVFKVCDSGFKEKVKSLLERLGLSDKIP